MLPGTLMTWAYSKSGQFTVLNHGQHGRGYRICVTCGWAEPAQGKKMKDTRHSDPWGNRCSGTFYRTASLGHQFTTDVVLLTCPDLHHPEISFWRSTLYAILEGTNAF